MRRSDLLIAAHSLLSLLLNKGSLRSLDSYTPQDQLGVV